MKKLFSLIALVAVLFGPQLLRYFLHRPIPDPLSYAIGDMLVFVVNLFGLWPAVGLAGAY